MSGYRNRPADIGKTRHGKKNGARSVAISQMRGSSIARVAGKCCGRFKFHVSCCCFFSKGSVFIDEDIETEGVK